MVGRRGCGRGGRRGRSAACTTAVGTKAHAAAAARATGGHAASSRSVRSLLVAVGLHLALGLPTATLEHRPAARLDDRRLRRRARARARRCTRQRPGVSDRRRWRSRARVAAADRPRRIRPPLPQCGTAAKACPSAVGRVGRGGRRRDLDRRGRAERAAVVAAAGRRGRRRLHAAGAVLARAIERLRSARRAHRSPARAQHHADRPRRPRRRVVSAHRARSRVTRRPGARRRCSGCRCSRRRSPRSLWVPARERLTDLATRRVYGEGHAPDEVLRTFGSRLTRALPLDELLLQLAESLKATMNLEVAEVWTRSADGIERAVSVPDRGPAMIPLGPEEETVIAHAGVSGPAWAQVWLPAILTGLEEPVLRTAPVTNSGELLGLIVVRRAEARSPFNEADDLALTELARQVGLALHNVKLDSALQESLDAVRRQADELRASRARIVEATDTERRRIERDLHDGAQQHLVALAVGVRLARQIADTDRRAGQGDARPDRPRSPRSGAGAAQSRARHLPAAADGPRSPRRVARGRAAAPRWRRRWKPRTSGVTRNRSRRPCTSVASRRSRTRASTRATTRVRS